MDKVATGRASQRPESGILKFLGIFNIFAAIAYGVSPIDLIPDLIPLLGLLDDAIAVPLFIVFAILSFTWRKKYQREAVNESRVINTQSREPQIPTSPY